VSGSVLLLNLAGAVALLLWAARMVRTGVERAYSAQLRRVVQRSAQNRLVAASGGFMVAVLLQSSTAVALILTGFAGSQIVAPATGLAMMLGADLGSALVVQILSFDLSLLVPVLLIAGTAAFLGGNSRSMRQFGRIVMGVALILISLKMIGTASEPLRESTLLPVIVRYLSTDAVTAFIVAAIFTWLVHSSVASVLLIMTFTAQGIIPLPLALVLVLGANIGGGIIATALTRGAKPEARAIPLGNLLLRGSFAIIALIVLQIVELPLERLGSVPAQQLVSFHLLFNVALLVIALPFTGLVSGAAHSFLLSRSQGPDTSQIAPARVSALDPAVKKIPRLALASATREVLHMSENIEIMLREIMLAYEDGDKVQMERLSLMDDEVDSAHSQIKLYLAEVSRHEMEADEALRCQELTGACIKLEHVGDIIVRNLLKHAHKKRLNHLTFSPQGWDELKSMHAIVIQNAQLALNVLISGDIETARQLVKSKEQMRELEQKSSQEHIKRLRDGTARSVESSEIHLDTIRDLKQINSTLASLAYPVLEQDGQLSKTRLA
jgi:phosphate:Na+ symporter